MDAIELLTRDHRTVEDLFSRFGRGDALERRSAAERVIGELSLHAAIEEEHLYPTVRREVPETEALIDHGLEEHQEAKEILARLDRMTDKAHTKAFAERMDRLEKLIADHVEEEEKELFPKVREAMTRTALNELGTTMNRARATAPTRPHPNAPTHPAAQAVVGRAAAVVDRMRDAVSGRDPR
jgi:hemerythrin superfamily protein